MVPETLLLLPGMMCDERLFAPQIQAFNQAYNVLVPQRVEPSIADVAHWVLASAPDGPLNVVGLSMGGIVAMAMIAIAPERIARLALLDTNHHADAPGNFEIRNRQIAEVRSGKLRDVIVDEMKPVYLAKENRNNQALLDLLVAMAMDVGAEAFVSQSIALRDRPDHGSALRQYQGPALVLCGEEDQLCPPHRHAEMASILPDATRVCVPGAGHISTLENPEAVNSALRDWLQRKPVNVERGDHT